MKLAIVRMSARVDGICRRPAGFRRRREGSRPRFGEFPRRRHRPTATGSSSRRPIAQSLTRSVLKPPHSLCLPRIGGAKGIPSSAETPVATEQRPNQDVRGCAASPAARASSCPEVGRSQPPTSLSTSAASRRQPKSPDRPPTTTTPRAPPRPITAIWLTTTDALSAREPSTPPMGAASAAERGRRPSGAPCAPCATLIVAYMRRARGAGANFSSSIALPLAAPPIRERRG